MRNFIMYVIKNQVVCRNSLLDTMVDILIYSVVV